MSTAKEVVARIVDEQPDDSSFDEILKELALARMIERGMADSAAGRVISDSELQQRMQSWRK